MCGDTKQDLWFTGGFRFIPEKSDNGKWTTSLEVRYKRFTLGVDYRPLTQRVGPIASFRLLDEKGYLPAIVVGTGPDQFDQVNSQAYFGTLSKRIAKPFGVAISPFVGVGHVADLDETKIIRGVTVRYDHASLQLFNNGFATHFVASYDFLNHHTVSFVYWGSGATRLVLHV